MIPDTTLASAFVEASHYGHERRASVDLIVLHTAECKQSMTSAEAVAGFFGMHLTGVSAHYEIDEDSIEQSVPEACYAWAAGHQGNARGIHIELSGYASESATDWDSDANVAMLSLASRLVADIAARWSIPLVWVDAAGLLAGQRGITTHAEVSRAWHESDHHDPGDACPIDDVIGTARMHLDELERLPSGDA